MERIGDSTPTANGAKEFTQGQPATGVDATVLTAQWLNAVQRELINIVTGAGLAVAPGDDSQVLKAIQLLLVAAADWSKISGRPNTLAGYGITDAYSKTEIDQAKAPKASPVFTGEPAAPTAVLGTNTTQIATTAFVKAALDSVVGAAPGALDTLVELAAALGNDQNFSTTMLNALAAKASISSIQAQSLTAFTSAGSAPSFTLSPVPAITAYVAGTRFRVKFSSGGGGSDTLNVSALGPKSLKQYDSSGAKVAAVIQGQLADVEYDGVDWVLLNPLPAAPALSFGFGQTWQNLNGSRGTGITYTNSTGRPIMVVVQGSTSGSNQGRTVYINGVALFIFYGDLGFTGRDSLSFVVPSGSTYSVTGDNIQTWSELR